MKPDLTIPLLKSEAAAFAATLTTSPIPGLYGVTDGKAIGTYVEHAFQHHLEMVFTVGTGNSARGIDLPGLNVDLKVTSSRQPQSSSPFRDATQKVYGLGYSLLVFVYSKTDDPLTGTAALVIEPVIFVSEERTADFQTTSGVLAILSNSGNLDDIDAFFQERNLPMDDLGRRSLAERVMANPPLLGYLTISNALQWRLQYGRAITVAADGLTPGVERIDSP